MKQAYLVAQNSQCTFGDQVRSAIESKASTLIIKTLNDTDNVMNLNNVIQNENNQYVAILVTNSVGLALERTVREASTQLASVYVKITNENKNNTNTSNNQNSLPNDYFTPAGRTNDLSATSITFIVLGTMAFVLLISAMWVIFYIIQRSRSIEERQRLELLIQSLTKRAISKMKHRKIKSRDKELISNEKCAICLERYKLNDSIRQLPCLHSFHKKEIDTWLYINQTCPVCKVNVLKAYGLNINSKSNCFQRILEYLNLVKSPIEINENTWTQLTDERRDTYMTIRSINSTNPDGRSNDQDLNTIDRLYSDFQTMHLKDISSDELGYNELVNTNNKSSSKSILGRKLVFFGDKGAEDAVANHVVFENDQVALNNGNNNKFVKANKKNHTTGKELNNEEKNSSSRWQPVSISIPKSLSSYRSNNSNDDLKTSILEEDILEDQQQIDADSKRLKQTSSQQLNARPTEKDSESIKSEILILDADETNNNSKK